MKIISRLGVYKTKADVKEEKKKPGKKCLMSVIVRYSCNNGKRGVGRNRMSLLIK